MRTYPVRPWFPALPAVPAILVACSGSTVSLPAASDDAGDHSASHAAQSSQATSPSSSVTTSSARASTSSGGGSTSGAPLDASAGADASGPRIYVRVEAVQTPISESGSAHETPVDQRVGILGLTLLKGSSDPSPLVVFSRSQPIDTPYNAGSSTIVGSAPASALVAGRYTVARVPVADVQFTVAGTYHAGADAFPGDFTDLIALTSGVTLAGAGRARGWWSSSFAVDGMTEGQTSGADADIAQPGAGSGVRLDLSGDVAAYVFPVDLTVPSDITSDLEVVFTVNTYEDFHWQDQSEAGYATGVFDVSSTGFEPVTQLGANSFTVTIGPAPGK